MNETACSQHMMSRKYSASNALHNAELCIRTSTESIYLTGRKISKSQLPIEHVDVPGHSYLYFQSYQKLWDGFTMK